MERWKLVADVGGTNVRIARSRGPGDLRDVKRLSAREFPTFLAALDAYLGGLGRADCDGAAIAAAGPIRAGEVKLTNGPWCISASDVSAALGGGSVALFNDLEAVAFALPHLKSNDLRALGGPGTDLDIRATRLAVNVGTGLGAAAAIPFEGGWAYTASEAGHMSFAAAIDDEVQFIRSFESIEDLLSGRGVRRLYQNLRDRQREACDALAEDFDVFAQPETDRAATEVRQIFNRLLARVSGDLVLATAAWGGIFLCGSVARAWSEGADTKAFREAFEKKGAMSARMKDVGTSLITLPEPALHGLTFAAARR